MPRPPTGGASRDGEGDRTAVTLELDDRRPARGVTSDCVRIAAERQGRAEFVVGLWVLALHVPRYRSCRKRETFCPRRHAAISNCTCVPWARVGTARRRGHASIAKHSIENSRQGAVVERLAEGLADPGLGQLARWQLTTGARDQDDGESRTAGEHSLRQ